MPKDRKFVNPLTQSTETLSATETFTESETLPSTYPTTYTSTLPQIKHRKRGKQAFEKTHERITLWIDSDLKQRFEKLAEDLGSAKSTLLDEAINDLLTRYARPKSDAIPDDAMKKIIQPLQRTLAIEEREHKEDLDHEKRMRLDTQEHHFKKWLRSHDQVRGVDFFKRFLADSRMPEHASRALYEAKMRSAGYSQEDVYLFQDAWKTMLFFDSI